MTPKIRQKKPRLAKKDFLGPGAASPAGESGTKTQQKRQQAAWSVKASDAEPGKRPQRRSGKKKNGAVHGKKLNILISGVTTTIGRNLAIHLASNDLVGTILGVGHHDKPDCFNNLPKDKFTYEKCDILKSRELKNLFNSKILHAAHINSVVHLAFHNQPLRGEDNHRLNVEGTRDFLGQCIEMPGISKFVFKSSDIVYELTPHNPVYLDENAPLNFDPGVDPWIKDRVDADMICRGFMDNERAKIVILRMSNIIGRNVVSQFNTYFDSKPVIKTMGFDPLVNLLHMKDAILALTLALIKPVQGIYNIGGLNTAPVSVFAKLNGRGLISLPEPLMGLANLVQRIFGLTKYYYNVDRDRQKYSALLDITRAKRELGYEPRRRIEF